MVSISPRRLSLIAAIMCGLGVIAGCGGPSEPVAGDGEACRSYVDYQGYSGTTVTISSSFVDVQMDNLTKAWETFQDCTGIDIDYVGTDRFESTLLARVRAGTGPDIALFPQPGLLADMARASLLKPASAQVKANAAKWWSPAWLKYGTVDGQFYAAPVDANVKSFVWYSPQLFRQKGYPVPKTWDEMLALSERIAADGIKPWCAGIESGTATGWPVTDWLEDVLLRTEGTKVYDEWVEHEISFNDPRMVAALDRVGAILKNPDFVNGGYGDVKSIATTAFQEGGLPILEHKCAMHHQASFYTTWWPITATIGEHGDLYAFYLPPIKSGPGRPVLAAGTFAGVFNDRPEVAMVAAYLSTPEFANSHARTGNAASANRGLDPANLSAPVMRLSAELLIDLGAEVRFDGSDLMPASVGAGTFWTEMTKWINGKDSIAALTEVETSWPPS